MWNMPVIHVWFTSSILQQNYFFFWQQVNSRQKGTSHPERWPPPWTLQDANKCVAQSETASFAKAAEYSLLRLWFPDTPSLHGEEIPLMPFQEGCRCCSSFWCLSSEHEKSEDCCIILLLFSLFIKRYWPKILALNWLNLTGCNRNQTLCCTIHVAKRVLSVTALLPSKRQKPQTEPWASPISAVLNSRALFQHLWTYIQFFRVCIPIWARCPEGNCGLLERQKCKRA